jgi:hypothetical protein
VAESLTYAAFRLSGFTLWLAFFGGSARENTLCEAASHGKKGGKARLETMTEDQRKESARKAAQARWDKQRADDTR